MVTFAVHADGFIGQFPAALPGLLARRRLGIDGVEIAARRQRIWIGNGVAARRRRRIASIQSIDQRCEFGLGTLLQRMSIVADVADRAFKFCNDPC